MEDESNQSQFDQDGFLRALHQAPAVDPHAVPADLTAGMSGSQLAAYQRWVSAEDRLAEFDDAAPDAPRSERTVWTEEKRAAYRRAVDEAETAKQDLVASIRAQAGGRTDPA